MPRIEAQLATSLARTVSADFYRISLDAVMQSWEPTGPAGQVRLSASQLIELANSNLDLKAALTTVASHRSGDLCPARLGRYLNKNKERVVNGRRIVRAGASNGVSMYRLITPTNYQVEK
jgi:hypothetical protein